MKSHALWSGFLIVAALTGCTSEAPHISKLPSLQGQGAERGDEIPTLFANAVKELQNNPVPVLLPKVLPKAKNLNEYNAVNVKNSTDGYEMLIYSTFDVSNGSISMSAMQAALSGKFAPEHHPGEDVVGGIKEWMKYSKSIIVDGTPMTFYSKAESRIDVAPSDIVVWRDGNWLLTTQGEPNDIERPLEQVPENTSIGLAKEMLVLMKQLAGKEVKEGYISGQQAPRRTLSMEWTYDGQIWYSIDSFDWEYAFKAKNSLIKAK